MTGVETWRLVLVFGVLGTLAVGLFAWHLLDGVKGAHK